jgi:hypothetical protein
MVRIGSCCTGLIDCYRTSAVDVISKCKRAKPTLDRAHERTRRLRIAVRYGQGFCMLLREQGRENRMLFDILVL